MRTKEKVYVEVEKVVGKGRLDLLVKYMLQKIEKQTKNKVVTLKSKVLDKEKRRGGSVWQKGGGTAVR